MTAKLKTLRNTNDAPMMVNTSLSINEAREILPANPNRMGVVFSVSSPNICVIRYYEAGVDNNKDGIFIAAKVGYNNTFKMDVDGIYPGSISAIAETGTPTICVTEL